VRALLTARTALRFYSSVLVGGQLSFEPWLQESWKTVTYRSIAMYGICFNSTPQTGFDGSIQCRGRVQTTFHYTLLVRAWHVKTSSSYHCLSISSDHPTDTPVSLQRLLNILQ